MTRDDRPLGTRVAELEARMEALEARLGTPATAAPPSGALVSLAYGFSAASSEPAWWACDACQTRWSGFGPCPKCRQ